MDLPGHVQMMADLQVYVDDNLRDYRNAEAIVRMFEQLAAAAPLAMLREAASTPALFRQASEVAVLDTAWLQEMREVVGDA